MEILKTNDYSLFKDIRSNREVDNRHVKSLVQAISVKNLLHLNPIVCNSDMEVIDGQHRLEAARILGVEIYYTTDGDVTKEDIARINSNMKNWSMIDYVNFWTVEKKPGFDKLSSFLSANPGIPVGTALKFLSGFAGGEGKAVKEGKISVSDYDFAVKVAATLKWYRNMIDFAYERNFALAVAKMLQHPDYDHEVMKKKLEYQSRSLVKCINTKQYVEMLEEIYNYKSSKNQIRVQ